MLTSNDNIGPSARRKRPTISCRECHRRKQKCDRRQPCAHCMKRGKNDACLYELNVDYMLSAFLPVESEARPVHDVSQTSSDEILPASNVIEDGVKLLGYANDTKGTSGIIRGLKESTDLLDSPSSSQSGPTSSQYASIIRELPSRRHTDILVQAFFENVAWHYDIVDKATFASQLSQWRCLTHHQLKQAPDGLPASLRSFPALLFQILAQALLFQPTDYDEYLDDLKYAADMELSDRAADYSDAGHRLASSFGKSELDLVIVQAELMRACFLKTIGAVIEAWHTLGVAIRDAQELGLHVMEPELYPRTEKLADHEPGRKVWFILHLWDAHMAIVLGRPMSTRMNPNDVPWPMSWACSSSTPKQPQPRDVILCGYHTAYKFLQDIYDLEKVDDYRVPVENIHRNLVTNIANLPAWASTQRPRQGEPPWLSAALETMFTEVQFVMFALHRPFIFAEQSSRHCAFNSAMQILESQARLFDQTESLQYKSFSLVFATFDAMVLIAAVRIHFPEEFAAQFHVTKKYLEWGLNRLEHLQTRNKLASSAYNVVQRLYQKAVAAASPMEFHSLGGDAESGNFADIEAQMSEAYWNGMIQPELGNVLPPRPLNELLSNGYLSIPHTGRTDPLSELY